MRSWSSSFDFSFVSQPNLDHKPSENAELSVEEAKIERFKKGRSKQINWIDFFLKCFRNQKNISIYTSFERDHPMALINGYDGMVHREPFQKCRSRLIRDEALKWNPLRCVIKCIRLPPLDRDLMIRMLPARWNHDRYNSPIYATCVWWIWWTASPRDPRTIIWALFDPTPRGLPRVLHTKYRVELSLTREKSEESIEFIMWRDYVG